MGFESSRDSLVRKVQFALELVDPITGSLVSKGVSVEAIGVGRKPGGPAPVVNRSGRFVWLDRGIPLPAKISYDPGKLPYTKGEVDLSGGLPDNRLVGVRLRPNRAYAIPTGVTAIRGCLFEMLAGKRQPVTDAIVQLAWGLDRSPAWIPPVSPGIERIRPGEGITDKDGEFIVFARLPRQRTSFSTYVGYPPFDDPDFVTTTISPNVEKGMPKARLQVTRQDIAASRTTSANFKFLDSLDPGRIPDGGLLSRELQLDWNKLVN